ncbi:hypothetical protein SVAN01_05573 [Stagonosporopsis vannaccii]|nr:hypothetical protein SVAN01_05573 [Stagonosporopsis vannaccii]
MNQSHHTTGKRLLFPRSRGSGGELSTQLQSRIPRYESCWTNAGQRESNEITRDAQSPRRDAHRRAIPGPDTRLSARLLWAQAYQDLSPRPSNTHTLSLQHSSPSHTPPPKSHFTPVSYGAASSSFSPSPHDSAIEVSPTDPPFAAPPLLYTYSHPHGRRIIPPSISGHGRLIVAHRTVPYWGGVLIVIGSFAWAVFIAMHVFELLGARHPSTRPDYGRGDCEGWFC